jgi:hypothetical protein
MDLLTRAKGTCPSATASNGHADTSNGGGRLPHDGGVRLGRRACESGGVSATGASRPDRPGGDGSQEPRCGAG